MLVVNIRVEGVSVCNGGSARQMPTEKQCSVQGGDVGFCGIWIESNQNEGIAATRSSSSAFPVWVGLRSGSFSAGPRHLRPSFYFSDMLTKESQFERETLRTLNVYLSNVQCQASTVSLACLWCGKT